MYMYDSNDTIQLNRLNTVCKLFHFIFSMYMFRKNR